jgi:Rrf2 family iron-sulfur cluster assembly transcriptional regulator
MDLIRRDTDYAFRLAAMLAQHNGSAKTLSARALAKQTQVSYALTCKILQKLNHAGIVESTMGPKGGWKLAKKPESIQFRHLIEAVQGPVAVNRCLLGNFDCPLQKRCPAHPKMAILQTQIDDFLKNLTLGEFVSKESANE